MKQCKICVNYFQPKRSNHIFCSKSCTDLDSKRRLDSTRKCGCGSTISRAAKSCARCSPALRAERYIRSWLSGEESGGTPYGLSKIVRDYLLKLANYRCSVCGFNERHPDDGSSVLEIDHIDGNGSNHSCDNLQVLCPNHHALTSTYRGRNQGNGRKVFYTRTVRVDEGTQSTINMDKARN